MYFILRTLFPSNSPKYATDKIQKPAENTHTFKFQFQFHYQVIVEHAPIKTTEALLYRIQMARWLSSASYKLAVPICMHWFHSC